MFVFQSFREPSGMRLPVPPENGQDATRVDRRVKVVALPSEVRAKLLIADAEKLIASMPEGNVKGFVEEALLSLRKAGKRDEACLREFVSLCRMASQGALSDDEAWCAASVSAMGLPKEGIAKMLGLLSEISKLRAKADSEADSFAAELLNRGVERFYIQLIRRDALGNTADGLKKVAWAIFSSEKVASIYMDDENRARLLGILGNFSNEPSVGMQSGMGCFAQAFEEFGGDPLLLGAKAIRNIEEIAKSFSTAAFEFLFSGTGSIDMKQLCGMGPEEIWKTAIRRVGSLADTDSLERLEKNMGMDASAQYVQQGEAVFVTPQSGVGLYSSFAFQCTIAVAVSYGSGGELLQVGMAHIDLSMSGEEIAKFFRLASKGGKTEIYIIGGAPHHADIVEIAGKTAGNEVKFRNIDLLGLVLDSVYVSKDGKVQYGRMEEIEDAREAAVRAYLRIGMPELKISYF